MTEVQLHLDIQNSLLDTLKQTQVVMQKFNDNLQNAGRLTNKVEDHYDEIYKSQKKITESSKIWTNTLGKLKGIVAGLAAPIAAIFSTAKIIDTTKAVLAHNTAMKNLSFRMGEAGKTTGQLTSAMFEVSEKTGISTDKSLELIDALRGFRIPTAIVGEMATATVKFTEVTGMAADTAAQMTGNLMRMGKVGARGIKEVQDMMVGVQRAVGLTANEMEILGRKSVEVTQALAQFGRSEKDIVTFNKGFAQMVGAFSRVGVKVEEVTELIDNMLDPGKIEDNALLYAKLGISMEEALSGDMDPALLISRFKDLGQELKDMSGPAAAAMAQSLGLPLRTLRQMAEVEDDLASASKDTAEAWQEQMSPQQQLQKAMERISTVMEKIATGPVLKIAELLATGIEKFMTGISKIFGGEGGGKALIIGGIILAFVLITKMLGGLRNRLFAMNTETAQHLSIATEEALVMAHRKAGAVAAAGVGGAGRKRTSGIEMRVRMGTQFAEMQSRADEFSLLAERRMLPAFKKMTESTEQWIREISYGAKGYSRIALITEQTNKSIKERMELHKWEASAVQEGLRNQLDSLNAEKSRRDDRKMALEGMREEQGKLTAEQNWELKRLENIGKQLVLNIGKVTTRIGKEEKFYDRLIEGDLRKLSEEQRFAMKEELEGKLRSLELQQKEAETRRETLTHQAEILGYQKVAYQTSIESLKVAVEKGSATTEEVDRYAELVKKSREVEEASKGVTIELSKANDELSKSSEMHEKISKDLGKVISTGVIRAPAQEVSFWHRVLGMAKAAGNNIGSSISDGALKIRNSAKAFGATVLERMNPVNWFKGIRAKMRGIGGDEGKEQVKATKGLSGGIGKLLGPIGLLFGILMSIKPVQEFIKKVMEKLQPVLTEIGNYLQPLLDALMPLVDAIAKALLPLLKPLIEFLLPPLIAVLGVAIWTIGKLVTAIGHLIGVFSKGTIYETVMQVGTSLSKTGIDMLRQSVSPASGSTGDVLTSGTAAGELGPMELHATGSGIDVRKPQAATEGERVVNKLEGVESEIGTSNAFLERIAETLESIDSKGGDDGLTRAEQKAERNAALEAQRKKNAQKARDSGIPGTIEGLGFTYQ